jgi:hypothetical protein
MRGANPVDAPGKSAAHTERRTLAFILARPPLLG